MRGKTERGRGEINVTKEPQTKKRNPDFQSSCNFAGKSRGQLRNRVKVKFENYC